MTYKFLNTIIDDLFAFVIKMPLLHRISVFRCVGVRWCAGRGVGGGVFGAAAILCLVATHRISVFRCGVYWGAVVCAGNRGKGVVVGRGVWASWGLSHLMSCCHASHQRLQVRGV
jgi:hypothetical protein